MKHRGIVTSLLATGFVSALFAVGCGRTTESDSVKIALGLNDPSFKLEGVTLNDWTIVINGCKSGFTATINSTTANPKTSVNMFKFDRACKAGLQSFTYDGELYTKDGGGVLNTEAGTKADFKSTTNKKISIGVGAQLDSPLTASSKANFNFFQSTIGNNPIVSVSQPQSLSVSGVEAPNFSIIAADLIEYANDADGTPTYALQFECGNTIVTPANTCATVGGEAQSMAAMDIKIVDDTFSGTPTYDNAQDVFNPPNGSAGTVGTVDAAIGAKGGMKANVTGKAPVVTHLNSIVFLRYKTAGGASYRYFNMDVNPPVN
jgi:hypothetical protein